MIPFLEEIGATLVVDIGKQILFAIPHGVQNWRFRRFFGRDAVSGTRIYGVVDPVTHPTPPNANRYIKQFLGRRPDQPLVGPTHALGLCSVRVSSYASALFGQRRPGHTPLRFAIDYDVADKWDATFISFGSSDSNLKTFDIETLPEQKFYSIAFNAGGQRVFRVGNREFGINAQSDCGILLKMRNPTHPEHILFVCAGLGEWGTSGAAFYLFRNWSRLRWRYGRKDFCKVIRVNFNSDESATEIFSLPD